MSGTKIKICGLLRHCDVSFVNDAMPDYTGFVFYDKSRRYVSFEQAKELRVAMRPAIKTVGVFVNAAIEQIALLYSQNIISVIQLHGSEDDAYIARLRALDPSAQIWKAYQITSDKDIQAAKGSTADIVLLDSGGGTGLPFDWWLLHGFSRPFVLAGGLTPENIQEAVSRFHPYAVDISSGVESGGFKDRERIIAAVKAARGR